MPSSQELGSCGKKLAHTDQSRYLDHAEEVPAADQTRQQNTKAVLEPQTNERGLQKPEAVHLSLQRTITNLPAGAWQEVSQAEAPAWHLGNLHPQG